MSADPHGLKARMRALGLTQVEVAKMLGGVVPNTMTRAMSSTEESDTRPRIDALFKSLEVGMSPASLLNVTCPRCSEVLEIDALIQQVDVGPRLLWVTFQKASVEHTCPSSRSPDYDD